MRQFPNHNHKDWENTMSFVTEHSEGADLKVDWGSAQCRGGEEDTVPVHQQLPCLWWTNELFLFQDTSND